MMYPLGFDSPGGGGSIYIMRYEALDVKLETGNKLECMFKLLHKPNLIWSSSDRYSHKKPV